MLPLVRVIAAWLQRDDGSVLIAQRASPPAWRGWWELPGGKVEQGEDDAGCLRREIFEELGVDIEVGAALVTVFHDEPTRRIAISVYAARIIRGEPECKEHLDLAWVALGQLAAYPLLQADLVVLRVFDGAQ